MKLFSLLYGTIWIIAVVYLALNDNATNKQQVSLLMQQVSQKDSLVNDLMTKHISDSVKMTELNDSYRRVCVDNISYREAYGRKHKINAWGNP